MATCMRDGARCATPASTPSRLTQAGARHRERAEPIVFFPSSPPSPSVTAPLSSSPSSPVSPSSASTGFLPPPPLHLSFSSLSQPSTVSLARFIFFVSVEHHPSSLSTPASIHLSTDLPLPLPPSSSSSLPISSFRGHPLPCFLFLSSPSQPSSSPSSSSSSPSSTNRHRSPLSLHRHNPDSATVPSPVSLSSRSTPVTSLHLAPSIAPAIYRRSPPPPPSSPLYC